jgi:hypothetical protein
MEQILLNLNFRVFGISWLTCSTTLLISDYLPYIDSIAKILLIILGLITGLLMRKAAKVKAEQAEIDLEVSKMKLEEEILHKKRKE